MPQKQIPKQMTEEEFCSRLFDGAGMLGITLPDETPRRFVVYKNELKVWNAKINLTSVDSDADILTRHFLDSLTLCAFLKGNEIVLDVGSGAGFPGLALKIAMPGLKVVLLDQVQKKVFFMRHVIRTLGLEDIEAIADKAESAKFMESRQAAFDCVTSRALIDLKGFILLARPFLKPGGFILAMKGPGAAKEAQSAFGIPGMGEPVIKDVIVPFEDRKAAVVIVRRA